jgi:hypothetical protein
MHLEERLPLHVDVLVAEGLPPDERDRLAQELGAVGLVADLQELPPRRSLGYMAWIAMLVVPLKPFYDQLAKDFASDAHRRLKTTAQSIFKRSDGPADQPRPVILQDSATGVQIVLERDLPDAAYAQLLAFDLGTIRHGPLHYDKDRRRWRSELDEADAGPPGRQA